MVEQQIVVLSAKSSSLFFYLRNIKTMLSLSLLIKILFVGLIVLLLTPAKEKKILKQVALTSSFTAFVYSLLFWLNFDNLEPNFQFIEQFT